MKETYCETIRLIEGLHRLWLEVVKVELDRTGIADIDNIQDLILSKTGKEELTVAKWARGLRSDCRLAQTPSHTT
ncbi:MAG: hypothetical protein EVA87_13670 [Rhodospirillaceae bacterium]|nr:hypothetical protein [Rhodospirillaceae bacterium]RPG04457.1 MAG: hypothetical protein CBC23_000380 [Rhodospirillaceae bacterium TMED63]RZO35142.1 MAG: hypothetical protein EVA87_13670 [Rhodospirillaceae bacterium]